MRPLTMTIVSFFASIALALAAYAFAENFDISQTISPAIFTTLLICVLCTLSALACLWISLSYLLLAYAQHTTKHKGLIKRAARLTIPSVRRTLAGALALSLFVAQPAYADEPDDAPTGTPIIDTSTADISWGSPDLLDIATQNDEYAQPSPAASPAQSSSTPQPSPTLTNPLTTTPDSTNTAVNPLTSTPTTTPPAASTPSATSPPRRALSPPALSLPVPSLPTPSLPTPSLPQTSTPSTYTVKSGDTVWSIAARYLPATATDSDIARACLAWSAANPTTLENPNLIFPGQTLTIPQETH